MIEIDVTCINCHETVKCLESDMRTVSATMQDSIVIEITQWKCPKCGFVHSIEVNNFRTKELFRLLKKKMAEAEKLQRDLNIARSVLNARYDGSVYQCGEQKFKLELCTPDAAISGEQETTNA